MSDSFSSGRQTLAPPILPRASGRPWKNLWIRFLIVALLVLAASILYLFNPQEHGFYPFCIFYRTTGLLCPGCGSLRALHELSHGHVMAAIHYNPLLVLAMPLVLWACWRSLRHKATAQHTSSTAWLWIGLAVLITFAVVRNLPVFKRAFGGI